MAPGPREQSESEWVARKRREARRYWNEHPISVDSVPEQPGTRESFDALYERWSAEIDAMRLEFLESCRGARVLEVGCGIAQDGRFLTENGIDYCAVDYSRASLRLAREHFRQHDLPARFTNADATSLPFRDGSADVVFSIGVVHHIPDVRQACREIVRVTAPGGTVRVMVYHRHSYHYLLLSAVVIPLIWLILRAPFLAPLAERGPAKLRDLYRIALRDGFGRQRLLGASTDTSTAGEGNYNPLSHFLTERELREWFADLDDHRFVCSDLKYFPLPFGRRFVQRHWGFFLTLTATKPA
jgi:ubiquinone/menaquinone biosynthesis C-methylase UbiE